MKTRIFIFVSIILFSFSSSSFSQKKKATETDREYWVNLMCQMSEPILKNMSKGELKKNMNIELSPTFDRRSPNVAYAEAFGRLMAGIAPWFNLPDDETEEGKRRKQMREWALASYANSVDPESPDYLLWKGERQVLVDAAYIANSFIRAPKALWEPLDETTKQRYIKEFKALRNYSTPYSNWLLFRAIIETFLLSIDENYDGFAIDVTIRKMEEWYVTDGWYSDGPEFSIDYYNSYVIHPMLVEILEILKDKRKERPVISFDLALKRMQRYNELSERLISPEATFPAIGRSMTYRMGAFQALALSAWKYGLPTTMSEGQVRNALTSVMKRMFSIEGNFDKDGFLQLGFVGHQPDIADYYTNNGSVYMTSLVFLPLGLAPDHSFWTSPAEEWTSQKAWSGKAFPKDYHRSEKR